LVILTFNVGETPILNVRIVKDKGTKKILSDLESGYDLIAEKFSSTRAFMWRDLGFVKDMVKPGDRVLDFGCGNGRLAGFLLGESGREERLGRYVGVDISQKLIDIASQKYSNEKTKFIKVHPVKSTTKGRGAPLAQFNRVKPSSLRLPLKDNQFDIIFSIAVFHHFPSREYALEIAKELRRVLKPGGKIVVTVWNLWQKQFLRFGLKNLKRSDLESKSDWRSFYIPFKAGEKVFRRYHHPFKIGELNSLMNEAGFKTRRTKEGWNLVYIGRK